MHFGRPLTPGELACGLSHMQLWRQLLQDAEADAYVVLEDDVKLSDNLPEIVSALQNTDAAFVKLSGNQVKPMRKLGELTSEVDLYKLAYGPLNTCAYFIRKEAVPRLLSYCYSMSLPIDTMLDRSFRHGVDIYAVIPYPVHPIPDNEDNSGALSSQIGHRDYKYKSGKSELSKYGPRLYRLASSFFKRYAEIKLRLGM
nr:glycosyltransferase family 25 protein [Pseudovibrio hongkongensis]